MLYSLYEPIEEVVEMNFELPEDTPGTVFGIVPRRSANKLRKERFDVVCRAYNDDLTLLEQIHQTNQRGSPSPRVCDPDRAWRHHQELHWRCYPYSIGRGQRQLRRIRHLRSAALKTRGFS